MARARINVNFDSSFEETIKRLQDDKDRETGVAIFETLADLMVFCAMVGRNKFNDCNGVKFKSKVHPIWTDIIERRRKEGVAYLLALDAQEDHSSSGNILRPENEEEMWDYLQNFAFLGLQEIEKWFAERPHVEPKDVILDKMKEVAIKEGLGN